MGTIKSYTDLEQSRKLAEVLPLESADCFWDYDDLQKFHRISWFEDGYNKESQLMLNENNVCAWSLAALLGVIRETIGYTLYGVNNVYMFCNLGDKPWKLETEVYDNEIDVCCEMIIKLKGLNLL